MLHRFTLIFSLIAIFFVLTSAIALSQGIDTEKLRMYESEKKSELVASLLEGFIPLAGYAYAGDNIINGFAPAYVSASGLGLMAIGLFVSLLSECETFFGCSTEESVLIVSGILTYLGGRVWGIISTLDTVKQFNNNLKSQLGISLNQFAPTVRPSPYGIQVGLSFQLGK